MLGKKWHDFCQLLPIENFWWTFSWIIPIRKSPSPLPQYQIGLILSLFYTGNADYGKDEDSAEALLKRHEAFIGDLEGFKNTIEGLKEQATNCRQQETPIVDITGKINWYRNITLGSIAEVFHYVNYGSSIITSNDHQIISVENLSQKYATNLEPPKKKLKNQTDTNTYIVRFPCPIK